MMRMIATIVLSMVVAKSLTVVMVRDASAAADAHLPNTTKLILPIGRYVWSTCDACQDTMYGGQLHQAHNEGLPQCRRTGHHVWDLCSPGIAA